MLRAFRETGLLVSLCVGAKCWWNDQKNSEEDFCKFRIEQKRKYDLPLLIPEVKASEVPLMAAIHVFAVQNKVLWYKLYIPNCIFLSSKEILAFFLSHRKV